MRYLCVCMFLVFSLVACGQPGDRGDISHRSAEGTALIRANYGKADKAEDFCIDLGYYDDGICDPWCLEPDADCDPEFLDLVGCGITPGPCAVDEMKADTDGNGCVDSCVPNPDYVEPVFLELGEECSAHEECGDGNFCAKEYGDCDSLGVCEERVDLCTGEPVIDIVCACSGASFANLCDARYIGANIRHAGLCDWPEEDAENAEDTEN